MALKEHDNERQVSAKQVGGVFQKMARRDENICK
jgi:hypothetical protein